MRGWVISMVTFFDLSLIGEEEVFQKHLFLVGLKRSFITLESYTGRAEEVAVD